jgi:hypothetical protein
MPTSTDKGVPRPLLVHLVAVLLVSYVALTILALIPAWGAMQTQELSSISWHLAMIVVLVAFLYFDVRIGSWMALGWCVVVPLERYALAFRELLQVFGGGVLSIALIDLVRVAILFGATVASALLVHKLHFLRNRPANGHTNA